MSFGCANFLVVLAVSILTALFLFQYYRILMVSFVIFCHFIASYSQTFSISICFVTFLEQNVKYSFFIIFLGYTTFLLSKPTLNNL